MSMARRFNALLFPILLLTCLIMLAWLSTQKVMVGDLTANSRLSLTQPSISLLDKMSGEVEVEVFVNQSDQLGKEVEKLLTRYQQIKPDLRVNFISPEENPDRVREHNIRFPAEMLIHYQTKTEHLQRPSEKNITNALAILYRDEKRWLAYITGHGERSLQGEANFDLDVFAKKLETRGLKSQSLNLSEVNTIPDNASVVVIANPKVDYLVEEVELLSEYIKGGGNLLWLTEPDQGQQFSELKKLLKINFLPGVIVDGTGQSMKITQPDLVPIIHYPQHIITKGFRLTTLFPQAAAIRFAEVSDWQVAPIIVTSEQSWNETSAVVDQVDYDQQQETLGPLSLLVALENDETKQRIIVSGDSDFISNRFIGNGGNLDLGVRIVNWLTADDELIDIPTRSATDLDFELSNTKAAIVGIGFLYVLPLIFALFGLFIWWRRKSQ